MSKYTIESFVNLIYIRHTHRERERERHKERKELNFHLAFSQRKDVRGGEGR